ncbi:Oxo-4-hydroxy-4-carboxy-5-ureidoimidazoline decarboxylase superfamily protein [Abortiporus biennis]
MTSVPPIEQLLAGSPEGLSKTLSILFEDSPTLRDNLVPQVAELLQSSTIPSYSALINLCYKVIQQWSDELKSQFIAGHPRIGEVKNLSHLSAQEQAAKATPPQVLARLAHLNKCYEYRYSRLIYITFVNGRTRAQIMEEMEEVLGLERSLSPDIPALESIGKVEVGSNEWKGELERAIGDVVRIAQSRLKPLGVE